MKSTGANRTPRPSVATLTREDGVVVCERCVLAETILSRMKGLLGRTELPIGEGLLIRPTSSIHTFFMRFPIDVVFLDRHLVVRKIAPGLRPWRGAFGLGSHAALELAAGECERRGVSRGDQLVSNEPGWFR